MPRKDTPAHSVFNPRRLDAKRFASGSAFLQGALALADLPRLAQDLHGPVDGSRKVEWSAQGEMRPGMAGAEPNPWLHLQAQALVSLTCQRCLGAVDHALHVDRWFRFVADEATAELQDDDCEEDLLALEPRPDMLQVLEDELIMALPLVPMHGECPTRPTETPGAVGDGMTSERPHPFAALASLKGKP